MLLWLLDTYGNVYAYVCVCLRIPYTHNCETQCIAHHPCATLTPMMIPHWVMQGGSTCMCHAA